MTENDTQTPRTPQEGEEESPRLYYAFHAATAKTYGPVDRTTLLSWVAENKLSTADQVCMQGKSSWTPLAKSDFARHVLGVADDDSSNAWAYLKRALRLIESVSQKASELYRRVIAFSQSDESDRPFLQVMTSTIRTRRLITSEKDSLMEDLRLASLELDRCEALDPDTTIEIQGIPQNITNARALRLFEQGRLELIWGSHQIAKSCFQESLSMLEIADSHFVLGLIYEEENELPAARESYERYLKLDPDGDDSIQALRNLERLKRRTRR